MSDVEQVIVALPQEKREEVIKALHTLVESRFIEAYSSLMQRYVINHVLNGGEQLHLMQQKALGSMSILSNIHAFIHPAKEGESVVQTEESKPEPEPRANDVPGKETPPAGWNY